MPFRSQYCHGFRSGPARGNHPGAPVERTADQHSPCAALAVGGRQLSARLPGQLPPSRPRPVSVFLTVKLTKNHPFSTNTSTISFDTEQAGKIWPITRNISIMFQFSTI